MYVKWPQDQYTKDNVSKIERKEKIQESSLHPSYKHSPYLLYLPSPYEYDYSHLKTTLSFVTSDKGQVYQIDISSSLGELALSSSSPSSSESPSLSSSSEASREGEGDSMKPPRRACHQAIRLTRVFTWYNSSLRVSRWASMRWSCTMITSRVTPPVEEKGVEVDGAEEAGGVVISVYVHLGWT